jgi:RNA polymerase subunit RPABC4/transcription elongation factor Spt4
MSLQGWQTLRCPKCDSTHFLQVIEMIWQNGLGTSQRPAGHACVKCHVIVDSQRMITHAKKLEAEQKIKDLESALG